MRLFADTSFYIAVVNAGDATHRAALDFMGRFKGRIVTTEYVLVECGNWLASVGDRETFVQLNRQIGSDPKTLVIHAEPGLTEKSSMIPFLLTYERVKYAHGRYLHPTISGRHDAILLRIFRLFMPKKHRPSPG